MSLKLEDGYSAGECVIMGISGYSVSESTRQYILKEQVTQFILFAHNYNANHPLAKEELFNLTSGLQSLSGSTSTHDPMLISVDQEGGRVQRFKNGFTLLPSAKKVAEKNSPQLAFEVAQVQARELFAAGIQLNFAPVCDINTNAANPVIGDRAYGDNESIVTQMVTASVRAHLLERVQPCIKHFPGHGDTHLDSHFALPTVTTSLEVLRAREWLPFQKAIKSGCNFLMSAHIMLPHLDAERPGTLSETFLKKYLREELRYPGIVVSDDMEMHAITHHYGADEAPILALEAGCDLLCYRSEAQAMAAIEAIKKAVKDGRLSADQLKTSIDRVRKIRNKIVLAEQMMPISERDAMIGSENHRAVIAKSD